MAMPWIASAGMIMTMDKQYPTKSLLIGKGYGIGVLSGGCFCIRELHTVFLYLKEGWNKYMYIKQNKSARALVMAGGLHP